MRKLYLFSIFYLAFIFLFYPSLSRADIDVSSGYWSTDFTSPTCNAWNQNTGDPNCDGVIDAGGWICTDGPDFIAETASHIVASGDMGYIL